MRRECFARLEGRPPDKRVLRRGSRREWQPLTSVLPMVAAASAAVAHGPITLNPSSSVLLPCIAATKDSSSTSKIRLPVLARDFVSAFGCGGELLRRSLPLLEEVRIGANTPSRRQSNSARPPSCSKAPLDNSGAITLGRRSRIAGPSVSRPFHCQTIALDRPTQTDFARRRR